MTEQGILYVACGEDFVAEAATSARTATRHTNLPIAIITDRTDVAEEYNQFDIVMEAVDVDHVWADKVNNVPRSPFDETLYLDPDIFVARPFEDKLFPVLEDYNIAMSEDDYQRHSTYKRAMPQYNSGVVLFDSSDATSEVFSAWHDTFHNEYSGTGDQIILSNEVHKHGSVRVCTLPGEYNLRWTIPGTTTDGVIFLHGRLKQHGDNQGASLPFSKADDETPLEIAERIADEINSFQKHVHYKPDGLDIIVQKENKRLW